MKLTALPFLAVLAACASSPAQPIEDRFQAQSWTKVGVDQAYAECQAEINRPAGIPSMYLCMKSKGWLER